MKFLVIQPKLEKNIVQLEREICNNPSADAVIFPEGYLDENLEQACNLTKNHNKNYLEVIEGYTIIQKTES